ncbi:unnamed protein product [Symbiodinium sp. KB8]|nr:unnamed protein product [Symbiodinium sp. KB8]
MAALTLRVSRLSGQTCEVQAAAAWTVADLRRAAEAELGGLSQIVRESGEILADASALSDVGVKHMETAAGLKIMGFRDQNSREPEEPGRYLLPGHLCDVRKLVANNAAFAALKGIPHNAKP